MLPTLYRQAFSRGASLRTLHHLVSTLAIAALLWGSEIWWTGTQHTIDKLNTTYNQLVRLVTGLPRWSRIHLLLCAASLPPLHLLFDHTSRNYGIKNLQGPESHPNKQPLNEALSQPLKKGVGLRPMAFLDKEITPPNHPIEDPCNPTWYLPTSAVTVSKDDKKTTATSHLQWLNSEQGIIRYTDRSRNLTNSAAWLITQNGKTIQEGYCNIGPNTHILNTKIHVIRGEIELIGSNLRPPTLNICADNQNVLVALTGSRCTVKEDLRICLEGIRTLQLAGSSVKGQWTPSYGGIRGNERGDKLAHLG